MKQKSFKKLPGSPIAYWINENIIKSFENQQLQSISDVKVGIQTGDTKRFLRYWFEINYKKISTNITNINDPEIDNFKWFPYNKGGDYRKWYGNHEYVINWENNGFQIKNFKNKQGKLKSRPQNLKYSFKQSISWSLITSSSISFRYYPKGFLFDVSGHSIFIDDKYLFYILGLLNTNITQQLLNIISPTINYSAGYISLIPIALINNFDNINKIVKNNILICKKDWDSYELSWNFTKHPLLKYNKKVIQENYNQWENFKTKQFKELRFNEKKLDETFSKIYNIPLTNNKNNQLSISLVNYITDIKSFISYAIGCMFGRYSLDEEGLQFAGGSFNINNYHKFIPDDDNIIPVLDTAYFDDDIVGYFTKFVETCFGEETL